MRIGRIAMMAFAVVLLVGFAGCGALSSAPPAPTTVPVTGKVTYQGRPLTKGTVMFEPEGAGKEGRGEIQPDGTYVLSTYKKDDGAVLGNHHVTVLNADKMVPQKYAGRGTSKLEMEVSEGKTDYSINLK